MVSTSTIFVHKYRECLITDFGGKCMNPKCGCTDKLEFAHKDMTPLSGTGGSRGSYRRIIDILIHWKCYFLLCTDCHDLFDSGKLEL